MPDADERMSPSGRRSVERGWPIALGVLLASAISLMAAYYLAAGDHPQARSPVRTGQHSSGAALASCSPAYLFGFANAALAGCDFEPGAALDSLAAQVESSEQGVVPDDLKAGFAEFRDLLEARGAAGACAMAQRLLGPQAPVWAGVLVPR